MSEGKIETYSDCANLLWIIAPTCEWKFAFGPTLGSYYQRLF